MAKPGGSHPGSIGGERSSKAQNERERNLGGGTDNSQSGMSKALLDAKYPGASKKKSKSAELSLENVGTLLGKIGDITNPALAGVKMGIEALTGVDLPTFDDSFSGIGPDVPSVGAGFADSGIKGTQMGADSALAKQSALQQKKKKVAAKPGFTLLKGVGGTLLGT